MGWAARANASSHTAKVMTKTRMRLNALRQKVQAREPLTHDDYRLLARCGPKTLAYIGYEPKVALS